VEDLTEFHWALPQMLSKARSGVARDGHLRDPKFVALRTDKDPRGITREDRGH
jgi:hypothetical protein